MDCLRRAQPCVAQLLHGWSARDNRAAATIQRAVRVRLRRKRSRVRRAAQHVQRIARGRADRQRLKQEALATVHQLWRSHKSIVPPPSTAEQATDAREQSPSPPSTPPAGVGPHSRGRRRASMAVALASAPLSHKSRVAAATALPIAPPAAPVPWENLVGLVRTEELTSTQPGPSAAGASPHEAAMAEALAIVAAGGDVPSSSSTPAADRRPRSSTVSSSVTFQINSGGSVYFAFFAPPPAGPSAAAKGGAGRKPGGRASVVGTGGGGMLRFAPSAKSGGGRALSGSGGTALPAGVGGAGLSAFGERARHFSLAWGARPLPERLAVLKFDASPSEAEGELLANVLCAPLGVRAPHAQLVRARSEGWNRVEAAAERLSGPARDGAPAHAAAAAAAADERTAAELLVSELRSSKAFLLFEFCGGVSLASDEAAAACEQHAAPLALRERVCAQLGELLIFDMAIANEDRLTVGPLGWRGNTQNLLFTPYESRPLVAIDQAVARALPAFKRRADRQSYAQLIDALELGAAAAAGGASAGGVAEATAEVVSGVLRGSGLGWLLGDGAEQGGAASVEEAAAVRAVVGAFVRGARAAITRARLLLPTLDALRALLARAHDEAIAEARDGRLSGMALTTTQRSALERAMREMTRAQVAAADAAGGSSRRGSPTRNGRAARRSGTSSKRTSRARAADLPRSEAPAAAPAAAVPAAAAAAAAAAASASAAAAPDTTAAAAKAAPADGQQQGLAAQAHGQHARGKRALGQRVLSVRRLVSALLGPARTRQPPSSPGAGAARPYGGGAAKGGPLAEGAQAKPALPQSAQPAVRSTTASGAAGLSSAKLTFSCAAPDTLAAAASEVAAARAAADAAEPAGSAALERQPSAATTSPAAAAGGAPVELSGEELRAALKMNRAMCERAMQVHSLLEQRALGAGLELERPEADAPWEEVLRGWRELHGRLDHTCERMRVIVGEGGVKGLGMDVLGDGMLVA